MLNWGYLFNLQSKLDERIKQEHNLLGENIFNDKILALYVELGELANETRCFKFWSKKPASERSIILEEYVDGIHFILSLGIEKGFGFSQDEKEAETGEKLTDLFNKTFQKINQFQIKQDESSFQDLFLTYLRIGNQLGFQNEAIYQAYLDKNEVNHQRQDNGY